MGRVGCQSQRVDVAGGEGKWKALVSFREPEFARERKCCVGRQSGSLKTSTIGRIAVWVLRSGQSLQPWYAESSYVVVVIDLCVATLPPDRRVTCARDCRCLAIGRRRQSICKPQESRGEYCEQHGASANLCDACDAKLSVVGCGRL